MSLQYSYNLTVTIKAVADGAVGSSTIDSVTTYNASDAFQVDPQVMLASVMQAATESLGKQIISM